VPEYLHPGVYIEEIEHGPRPIEGVPTSTVAFLGEAERGATTPRLVTSSHDYAHWFGDVSGADQFLPSTVEGFFENGGKRAFIARVVGQGATVASAALGDFSIRAAGPGAWGSRVFARIDRSTAKKADGTSVGFRLRLAYWSVSAPDFDPFLPENRTAVPVPVLIEDFDDLVTDEASPDWYGKRVPFIDLDKGDPNRGAESSALGVLVRSANIAPGATPDDGSILLSGGADAANSPGVDDYTGLPTATRSAPQGLTALELDPYRDVGLLYAPNASSDVLLAIIAHCERLRFRFAVIDCPRGVDDPSQLDPRSTLTDSPYPAFYYPWIIIADAGTGAPMLAPPGGHVLGVYTPAPIRNGASSRRLPTRWCVGSWISSSPSTTAPRTCSIHAG